MLEHELGCDCCLWCLWCLRRLQVASTVELTQDSGGRRGPPGGLRETGRIHLKRALCSNNFQDTDINAIDCLRGNTDKERRNKKVTLSMQLFSLVQPTDVEYCFRSCHSAPFGMNCS